MTKMNKCDGCKFDWLQIVVKNQTVSRYCKLKKDLEEEGKEQIKQALANVGLEDIDNLDTDEDEYEDIQEGEEQRNYPDDRDGADELRDARIDWDDTHKDKFLDNYMKGGN